MTLLALACYLTNVALGIASLLGKKVRRAWHTRLFLLTLVVTLLAAVLALQSCWLRALMLTLALIPLGLLPFSSAPVPRHPVRHTLISLVAAPLYLAAAMLWATMPGHASVWPAS